MSRRFGFSRNLSGWAFQREDGWCWEGGAAAAPSPLNPTWSHHSAGVDQAKAVWSLNAHAANLFNYSPSATACLMKCYPQIAGNWTIGFTHSIIDHWFRSRLSVILILSCGSRAQRSKIWCTLYYIRPGVPNQIGKKSTNPISLINQDLHKQNHPTTIFLFSGSCIQCKHVSELTIKVPFLFLSSI